jgi:NADH dehydrogenase FAD-containing subunit
VRGPGESGGEEGVEIASELREMTERERRSELERSSLLRVELLWPSLLPDHSEMGEEVVDEGLRGARPDG